LQLFFVAADIGVGLAIRSICRRRGTPESVATLCMACWLFNPLTATISTRGNAESVLALLVLTALSALQRVDGQRAAVRAGVLFGLAVHMKLYPIIYLPPTLLLLLRDDAAKLGWRCRGWGARVREVAPDATADTTAAGSLGLRGRDRGLLAGQHACVPPGLPPGLGPPPPSPSPPPPPTPRAAAAAAVPVPVPAPLSLRALGGSSAVRFCGAVAVTVVLVSWGCYAWCGWDFVEHAHLYHLARRDHRHNFSVHFYLFYLTFDSK